MRASFMRAVVNREYSLIKALEDLGVVPVGVLEPERTCFCPFHDNTNSKAAKIYDDDQGVTLFCFSEQKSFRSSDVIARFSSESLESVFLRIWNELSPDEQLYYLNEFENDPEVLSEEWTKTLEKLKGFKKGTISFQDALDIILATVEGEHNG